MNANTTNPVRTISCLLIGLSLPILAAHAQSPFPERPPANVTVTQDRDQMLWQMGITLPTLVPRIQDPNQLPNTWPRDPANPEGNWTDPASHTITRSPFGLWIQYQDFTGAYTPIDLLRMKDGTAVTSKTKWWTDRRPEILKDAKELLFGYVPPDSVLPAVSFSVVTTTGGSGDSAYIQKVITGTIDVSRYPQVRNVPVISATLRTPANAGKKVPVIVEISGNATTYWNRVYPKGWGICVFNPGALQPDNGVGLTSYLIGLVNKGNWRKPTDWGALVAWSWGISRLIDYFETDPNVDAGKIGVSGHSRYGKAALVSMAYEPRLAIAYPSCGGSLGTKMNRRHWGQDVESSASTSEYHWMAGSFFQWMGPLNPGSYMPRKVEIMPLDAHSLVALCAPRPVFLNGGTDIPAGNGDAWQDPTGMYLSGVYASPVYEFLGGTGLIVPPGTVFTSGPGEAPGGTPTMDVPFISGDIGYRRHHEGHTDAPDWPAFLQFAEKYFNNSRPAIAAGQSVNVSEAAAGESVAGKVAATDADGAALKSWQITGGDGASLFDINETTGEVMVKKGSSLDFETKTSYTLMVTVSDGALTSNAVPLAVNVKNVNDNVPLVKPAQIFSANRFMLNNTVIGTVAVTDMDDSKQPGYTHFKDWLVTGGTGTSVFAVNPVTGQIRLKNGLLLLVDNRSTYSLWVKASDGEFFSSAQEAIISVANKISVCHSGKTMSVSLTEAVEHLLHGDYLGACSSSSQNNYVSGGRNEVQGGGGDTDVSMNRIVVYPNPVQSDINISLGSNEQRIRKIELLDLSGRVLRQYMVNQKSSLVIPRGNLKPGTYLLRMQGDRVSSHKIIVK